MKTILITSILLASSSVSASQVYMKGSDCDINKFSKVIEVYAQGFEYIQARNKRLIQQRANERNQELIKQIKQNLLSKLSHRAKQYPNGLLITKTTIENDYQRNERKLSVKGRVEATEVIESCRKHEVIDAEQYQLLTASSIAGQFENSKVELNFEIDMNELKQTTVETEIEQPVVSTKSVFGIAFGEDYQAAKQKVGRFTLTWPVNKTQKLAFIGRDHALLFENERLKGYQYGFNLLPLGMANYVNIYQVGLMLEIDGEAQLIEQTELSEQLVENIKVHSDKAVVFQQRKYTDEPITLLSELYIGDMSLSQPSTLPCYDGKSDIQAFITQHQSQLLQWQNLKNTTSLYTGCNQLIELNSFGKVARVKLLESWAIRDASLAGLTRLVDAFKPWRFDSIHYQDSKNKLKQFGEVEDLYGTLAVSHPQWVGSFESYEGKLVAAELEKL